MDLMRKDEYCESTSLLIEDKVIVSNLQTAVYLFNDQFNNIPGTRVNLAKMIILLRTLKLTDDELVTFYRYAISRDPMCAESIPGDLMTKMVAAGKGTELLVPSTDGIDEDWLKEPCFAA